MNPLAGGTEIILQNGDYRATIVSVGAGIAALTNRGRDLVAPHPVDEMPIGYLGKALLPWPNRIAGGTYQYQGVAHEVPINEHHTGAALHGLASWQDWEIVDSSTANVTLRTFTAPQYGYPFALVSTVTYALDAATGLETRIVTRNVGKDTAPYGVSSHPYLTCNLRPVNECTLQVPASQVLTVDENLAPVEQVDVAQADLDYQVATVVGATEIDHAFTGLPQGAWNVDLSDGEMTVRLTSTEPWVQVYSGTNIGRIGLAVEPMTCPPNAFNSHQDLIELAPGQETTFVFSILEV